MSAPIKRHKFYSQFNHTFSEVAGDGDYVLHSDHIASHQFDEAKERALFEVWFLRNYSGFIEGGFDGYSLERFEDEPRQYVQDVPNHDWMVWTLSARSRAERFAGGVE